MKKCWNKDADERPSFINIQSILNPMDVNNWPGANRALQGKEVLYDVFPAHVAEALIAGREVEPERKECVTLFFSDIVGFTTIASTLDPTMVSQLLNRLYTKFDRLAQQHDVFKVETIGDAYVAVTNLVKDQPDHAARMANFAKAAVEEARKTLVDENDLSRGHIKIRVGLNCGPIVANVVGTRNKRYCLFGDSMNVTSRMETASEPYRIHASREAAELIRKQDTSIPIMNRGVQNIKGKGRMRTYWIHEVKYRPFMSPVASADASEGFHQLTRIESTGSLDLSQADQSSRGGAPRSSTEHTSVDLGFSTPRGHNASQTAASSSSGNDLNDVAISIQPASAQYEDHHTSQSSTSRSKSKPKVRTSLFGLLTKSKSVAKTNSYDNSAATDGN